ncbi:MAG: efflux RND transporter permease subunit, partial [Pseudomonadota bacterium]
MNQNTSAKGVGAVPPKRGITASIVRMFTLSQLSPLFLVASLLLGAAALILTPREEDPQIVVPVMDVIVNYPGASSEEVEKLATTPLENLLKQIDGVEYVYSASRPGQAVVTVRYYVGEDREDSLVKTWDRIMSSQDIIPPGVADWIVKPVEIDDVPIVLLTLSSQNDLYDEMALRRTADELIERIRRVENVGKSWVVGGAKRRVSVYPDTAKLASRGIDLLEVLKAMKSANVNLQAGTFEKGGREILFEAGPDYGNVDDVGATVVKTAHGRPVYLRDVATILDGAEDKDHYTRIGFGPAVDRMRTIGEVSPASIAQGQERPMVTVAIAKRKGSNAVKVAEDVIAMTEELQGVLVPQDMMVTISRDYGETADDKVNELVKHLSLAVVIIVVLLAVSLGFKESLIVSLAVPMTLAITLLLDLVFGYTINRVTLFALILSLGLLVDDPI